MKVLFCDPLLTQNLFYTYSKYLRQFGVESTVIMEGEEEWCHSMELPYFEPYRNPVKYIRLFKQLLDYAKGFDVIVCSGLAPMWFRWSSKPFIFLVYGSDLDEMAVKGWSGNPRQKFSIFMKMVHLLIKWHLVGSLRKAKVTVLAHYHRLLAKKIGLKRLHFLPQILDTDMFKPVEVPKHEGLILFHPVRHSWVDHSIADCKGNDRLLRAFARFSETYKARLILVDKGWDVEASKNLIKELGITVEWITPMPKSELVKFYRSVDIVLDQFILGVLSLVPIEAMACGVPVISYIKPSKEGFYAEASPVVSAHSEDDIYKWLCVLAEDKELRDKIGKEGVEWVNKFCRPDASVPKYIELFSSITID